jgi:hypothetical protein
MPSISFLNDQNTGFFLLSPSSGQIGVAASGAGVALWNGQSYLQFDTGFGLAWTNGTYLATVDTLLVRDGPGILAQRLGTAAHQFRIYQTFTDASNYERGRLGWSGNDFLVGVERDGTGSERGLILQGGAAQYIQFRLGGTNIWAFSNPGHLFPSGDNLYDIGISGTNRPRDIYFGRQIICPDGSAAVPALAQAVNLDTGIFFGGTAGTSFIGLTADGTEYLRIKNDGISIGGASLDTFLVRDAANTLAQRNGTNAQELRLYGTFTDSSNFERVFLDFDSGASAFRLLAERSGSGSERTLQIGTVGSAALQLLTGNTARWEITSGGLFRPAADEKDLGDSTHRIKDLYVSGEVKGGTQPNFNFTFNGDFEIWGSGTSAAPTGWALNGAGATAAKDTTNKKVSTASVSLTRSGTDLTLSQSIASLFHGTAWWMGKTITIGCWVRCSVASRARLLLFMDGSGGSGSTNSAYHTGSGNWEWLTATATVSTSSLTTLGFNCVVDTGNTSAQFDGATVVTGSYVSDFIPSGWRGMKGGFDQWFVGTNAGSTVAAGATVYLGPRGAGAGGGGDMLVVPSGQKRVAVKLTVLAGAAPGASQTFTYTLYANGDTGLAAILSGASQQFGEAVLDVLMDGLLNVSVKLVTSAGAAVTTHTVCISVEEVPN